MNLAVVRVSHVLRQLVARLSPSHMATSAVLCRVTNCYCGNKLHGEAVVAQPAPAPISETTMQSQLLAPDSSIDAVSPFVEMGAYEALWARQKTSFKSLADLVRESRDTALSSFVTSDETDSFANRVYDLLKSRGVDDFGVHVRTDSSYPQKLLDADHPVELLYYRGFWDLIYAPSVAIVGTRKPSEEGVRRAQKLAAMLVQDGYAIVSGLASGIDTAAHTAAIASGGNTIAVVGTPIGFNYPKENSSLQAQIENEFLLLSQVPVWRYTQQGPAGNRLFFPERNITMAAITKATVIVEASDTSGTLIQARAALKQGRQLFILESCFNNTSIKWPHKYEQLGAIRVKDYSDIARVLGSAEQALKN